MRLAPLTQFAFLTLPNYSMIAVVNAIEVLRMANRVCGQAEYAWQIVTIDGEPAASSNGTALTPTTAIAAMARPHLLLACGGIDVREAVSERTSAALRRLAREGVALGGLCTGTFALANAGLLRGRRCAIHWENLASIQQEFPEIEFVRDLYAIDRDRVTCTGGIAPLSLMLAVVEARLGSRQAAAVQAQFMVERTRAGAEPQQARLGAPGHHKLEQALRVMESRLEAPLQATSIARAVGLSSRQLERLFRRYLGQTPGAYAAGLRLERARSLLRETAMPVTEVASACGYITPSRFSAAYRGRYGCAPRDERAGFRPAATRRTDAHQSA